MEGEYSIHYGIDLTQLDGMHHCWKGAATLNVSGFTNSVLIINSRSSMPHNSKQFIVQSDSVQNTTKFYILHTHMYT